LLLGILRDTVTQDGSALSNFSRTGRVVVVMRLNLVGMGVMGNWELGIGKGGLGLWFRNRVRNGNGFGNGNGVSRGLNT